MSIQISNVGPKIKFVEDGKISYYNLDVAGSVYWDFEKTTGRYKITVDIVADGRCNRDSLKFFLPDVTNKVGWTNDFTGANTAVEEIQSWSADYHQNIVSLIESIIDVLPVSRGQKTMNNSFPVVIASNQNNGNTTPNYLRVTGAGTIASTTTSFSVKNIGNANGTFLGTVLKAGEPALNFDAGFYKTYVANSITYDATGTEFLIIYNS